MSSRLNENKYQLLIINHKKREEEKTRKRGPADQKRSLSNPGTNPLVPQGNIKVRDKDINTQPPPIHSRWLTPQEISERENLLMGQPYDYIFLTSGTHMAVTCKQL
jgi:hypothetical protein